jgi:hypothetical protein
MCVCRSSFSVAALVCTLSAPFVAERRQLHHCFDPLAADSLLLATFFPKPISLEFIELKFLPTKEAEKKKIAVWKCVCSDGRVLLSSGCQQKRYNNVSW